MNRDEFKKFVLILWNDNNEIVTHENDQKFTAIMAEYDRLTAEVETVKADRDSEKRWADEYHAQVDKLTAEVARLSADNGRMILALAKYAEHSYWTYPLNSHGDIASVRDRFAGCFNGWEIAEEALGGQNE